MKVSKVATERLVQLLVSFHVALVQAVVHAHAEAFHAHLTFDLLLLRTGRVEARARTTTHAQKRKRRTGVRERNSSRGRTLQLSAGTDC
jgi:hypothetical protein